MANIYQGTEVSNLKKEVCQERLGTYSFISELNKIHLYQLCSLGTPAFT